MKPLNVHAITESDLPGVLALEQASFPEPWSEAMLREELGGPGRKYLVATEVGAVVAYGGVMTVGTDAHVMTLAVSSDRRRAGLGSQLLLCLIDEALAGGAEHLTLELRVSNDAARALYEKFGFSPVGIRPHYYPDEDALVMWALDVAEPEYRAALDRIREEAA